MAALPRTLFPIIGLFCVHNIVIAIVSGDPDTRTLSVLCSPYTFFDESPFPGELSGVFQELVSETPRATNYDHYTSTLPWAGVYGHGACNPMLTPLDCETCMGSAREQTIRFCPKRVGAQVQLQDCRLRYEEYRFQESGLAT